MKVLPGLQLIALQKMSKCRSAKQLLSDGINELSEDETDMDIVLIDCPPNFNIVTKNAIVASDYILIPAKPDYLSTLGIEYSKRSIERLISEYNEYLTVQDDNRNGRNKSKDFRCSFYDGSILR